jgi:ribonuclease HII
MLVIGVDESGTGALAGPFVVAGVLMESTQVIPGVRDSKALSDKRRRQLDPIIRSGVLAVKVVEVGLDEIRDGAKKAWRTAIIKIVRALTHQAPAAVYMDGIGDRKLSTVLPHMLWMVKADEKLQCVGAASILAKTRRNDLMNALSRKYPEYGFDRNAGYGTPEHYEALAVYGKSKVHRPLRGLALIPWRTDEEVHKSVR